MEIWIWTQIPALVAEESLEEVASNHLCRLDREVLEREGGQDHRGEETLGQLHMPSSEAYEGNKPMFGNPTSAHVQLLSKLTG